MRAGNAAAARLLLRLGHLLGHARRDRPTQTRGSKPGKLVARSSPRAWRTDLSWVPHGSARVASMINTPADVAKFCDVPPAGFEPATERWAELREVLPPVTLSLSGRELDQGPHGVALRRSLGRSIIAVWVDLCGAWLVIRIVMVFEPLAVAVSRTGATAIPPGGSGAARATDLRLAPRWCTADGRGPPVVAGLPDAGPP
jgi:hypothetical protein